MRSLDCREREQKFRERKKKKRSYLLSFFDGINEVYI